MSAAEALGIVAYLVVVWAVCAAAAGAVMYGVGLAYYGVLRAFGWARDTAQAELERGLPHPTRKHGRRVMHAPVQGRSVRRRVFPLV